MIVLQPFRSLFPNWTQVISHIDLDCIHSKSEFFVWICTKNEWDGREQLETGAVLLSLIEETSEKLATFRGRTNGILKNAETLVTDGSMLTAELQAIRQINVIKHFSPPVACPPVTLQLVQS